MSQLIPWTSSKQEIYTAYKDIHKKYESLIADKSTSKIVKDREEKLSKELEHRVGAATPEAVVDGIIRMKKTVSKVLDDLSVELGLEAQKLTDIKNLVEKEKKELSELRDKALVQVAIETLIQEFEEKKSHLESQHQNSMATLSEEIEKKRQEWSDEKERQKKVAKELEQEQQKIRAREEDAYQYLLKQRHQKDDDEISAKKQLFEKNLSEKGLSFEKELKERENEIKLTEIELKTLREKQLQFEKEKQLEVNKVRNEVTDKLTLKFEHEIALLKQAKQSSETIYENRILALENYITKQDQQIDLLNQKYDAAAIKVQERASKAIEGASNAGALGAVNRIALEQAKSGRKQVES